MPRHDRHADGAGYAIDDWLFANHRIHVGLADMHYLLLVVSLETHRSDARALLRGLSEQVDRLAVDPGPSPSAPASPPIGDLSVEMACGSAALFGAAEMVRYENAAALVLDPVDPGERMLRVMRDG